MIMKTERTTGTTRTKNNRSARAIKTTVPEKPTTPSSVNDKLTLRELLTMISPTTGVSIPTAKALRESDTPIAIYATNNFSISVYPSGFALAVSYKRTTVVRVDECTDYSYDTLHEALANCKKSATPSHIGFEVFLDAAWPVRVTMTAEDRLEENNDLAARRAISEHPQIAADVQQYNRWLHGESVENQTFGRMMKEEMLERLTDKQKEVMILYYDEGYTQAEIAEVMGVSQKAVGQHIMLANKKIRKYMAENQ